MKLIYSQHTKPIARQKQVLEDTLTQYTEGTEQRDDILLLGMRV